MAEINSPIPIQSRERVLIVDDEESFAELVKVYLERTGRYEVRCLYRGKGVLDAARVWKPSIVLLDYMLPDMDGGQIFQRLKDDSQLRHIPIILLTGLAKEDTPLETGIRPKRLTMSKPVCFEKLEEAIAFLTTGSAPTAIKEAV
ncbi:MAG: CheY-like chemotaxis protein [Verrucomicrobiales bacterium]|jgi:CheY-like chemotaxis protein